MIPGAKLRRFYVSFHFSFPAYRTRVFPPKKKNQMLCDMNPPETALGSKSGTQQLSVPQLFSDPGKEGNPFLGRPF